MANFITRMRDRGLAAEPPQENPHDLARESWEKLRDYAAGLAIVAEEVDDENRTLKAENSSLNREVARLTNLNIQLSRENRMSTAYAESMRTRMRMIRESIEVADRESIAAANHSREEPREQYTPEEHYDAIKVHDAILRVEATNLQNGTALPVNAWMDNG